MRRSSLSIVNDDPLGRGYHPINEHDHEGVNSWASTASLIVCAMAGVGSLGLPTAMFQSGWLGLPLLLIVAFISAYTGIILAKTMDTDPTIREYSDIGERAFGRVGRDLAKVSVYITLGGVSIIFLILLGILMSIIVPGLFGMGFWILVLGVGLASPLAIAMKSYGEIKIVSWFGFAATAVTIFIACVLSLIFYTSEQYKEASKETPFHTHLFVGKTFASGFSVFTFAFGATAIFPSIYTKMVYRSDWPKSVIGGYAASLMIYLPVAIIGYMVYGEQLGNVPGTILDVIAAFDKTKTNDVLTRICSGIMICHIASAFPIVINPVFLALESRFQTQSKGSEFVRRLIIRGITLACFIVISLFFPYFLDVMSLLSCISVSLTGFILPCIFYWRICHPHLPEKILLTSILIFGIVGSAVGIYVAVEGLIGDVKKSPNPFAGLFTIHK
eukprot:TRINITY_DN7734_c0_g1_i2.p1 TRINITY_DN7734_c0_g1~~TRINITY_DN7734_c0_g1_i2.p1  ORF type:complete len:444 (+),score=121.57 TRINITY_DN7734_c0_g1_i2:64-1395(+)